MSRKHFESVILVLFVLMLAACRGNDSSNSKDTPIVTKSNELTQSPTQTHERVQTIQPPTNTYASGNIGTFTETPIASLSIVIQKESSSVQMESGYFDGFIILTRYYTLLDHGLYEESYLLLSSSQQRRYNFEDYTRFYSQDLQAIKITGMLPYNYWRAQQGLSAINNPTNQLRFVIFMTSYHKGAAWNDGGTPIPDNTTGFQSLILENKEWKIDDFNTSPWTK